MKLIITENRLYQVIDSYLTKTIKGLEQTTSEHGGQGRVDFKDKSGNSKVIIFFNRHSQSMDGMIEDSLYGEIYNIFSFNGYSDIQQHLIQWFQENFDGLGDIVEISTFDNDEYVY
jgi:hypothetical protein